MAGDMTNVRSAYAYFQGKRPTGSGSTAPTAPARELPGFLRSTTPSKPPAPPAPPAHAPAYGRDKVDPSAALAELQKRMAELEAALKNAGQVPVRSTPPIVPQAPQAPTAPTIDETSRKVQEEFDRLDAQLAAEIERGNKKLTREIQRATRDVEKVTGKVNRAADAINQQVPQIAQQVSNVATSVNTLLETFKKLF